MSVELKTKDETMLWISVAARVTEAIIRKQGYGAQFAADDAVRAADRVTRAFQERYVERRNSPLPG